MSVRPFKAEGFSRLVDARWWRAHRVEGGEPARMPDPTEAGKLWPGVEKSPGIELYHGVVPDFNGARDLDAAELKRLATIGKLRAGPGGRAIVVLREPWGHNLAVAFVA